MGITIRYRTFEAFTAATIDILVPTAMTNQYSDIYDPIAFEQMTIDERNDVLDRLMERFEGKIRERFGPRKQEELPDKTIEPSKEESPTKFIFPPKTAMRPSYIYFIATPGYIKIGRSCQPQSRIKSLSTSSPSPIETLAIVRESESLTETMVHKKFHHLRSHLEWFTDCEELREYINQLT